MANGTSRENGSNQRKPLRGLRPVAADMTGKGAPPLRRKGVASLAPRKAPSPANPEAHSIAWTFFYGESRATFRDRLGLDDGTWARGRGWCLWKALITLARAVNADDAEGEMAARRFGWRLTARHVIDEILADWTANRRTK